MPALDVGLETGESGGRFAQTRQSTTYNSITTFYHSEDAHESLFPPSGHCSHPHKDKSGCGTNRHSPECAVTLGYHSHTPHKYLKDQSVFQESKRIQRQESRSLQRLRHGSDARLRCLPESLPLSPFAQAYWRLQYVLRKFNSICCVPKMLQLAVSPVLQPLLLPLRLAARVAPVQRYIKIQVLGAGEEEMQDVGKRRGILRGGFLWAIYGQEGFAAFRFRNSRKQNFVVKNILGTRTKDEGQLICIEQSPLRCINGWCPSTLEILVIASL